MAKGRLLAVGIGPGTAELLTGQARQAIEKAEVIVGYKPYIQQIKDIISSQEVITTGMRGEVERCRQAIEAAQTGRAVAVVSSGDAGIYGMAGLLLELLEAEYQEYDLEIEVIPGITAASMAAAVLGAPLMNDFVVLSLSDLLTPREKIRQRLQAVIPADLVCVLYNPQSRRRTALFREVMQQVKEQRGPETVVGLVKNAGRPTQKSWLGQASEVPFSEIDMVTVVIIGNSSTGIINGRMVSRRGYQLTRDNENR